MAAVPLLGCFAMTDMAALKARRVQVWIKRCQRMTDDPIIAEIWEALRTEVTFWGDTCFASNLAMEKLERHGRKLPRAIEAVLRSPDLELTRQTDYWTDANTGDLLLIYFEYADTHRWDSARFLSTLRGSLRHEALTAVYQIWGPLRQRKAMPAKLEAI